MRARAVAASLAVVLAGCGGSRAGAGGGGGSWASKADAICARTEQRMRDRGPARSSADLERLMTAVVDDLKAGRSELKDLELPADRRKKAEPFLRDVDKVITTAEKIRDAGRDHAKVWTVAADNRVVALDLEEDAQSAGLRRCGRGLSSKGVDAVMMPGYARDVAELVLRLVAPIEAAERMPNPGHGRAYWSVVYPVMQNRGTGRDPESLSNLETDFTGPLHDAQYELTGVLSHYDGTVPLSAKALRVKERRVRAVMREAPAKGYALLKATGPPGEALLPRVKRAVRAYAEKAR